MQPYDRKSLCYTLPKYLTNFLQIRSTLNQVWFKTKQHSN